MHINRQPAAFCNKRYFSAVAHEYKLLTPHSRQLHLVFSHTLRLLPDVCFRTPNIGSASLKPLEIWLSRNHTLEFLHKNNKYKPEINTPRSSTHSGRVERDQTHMCKILSFGNSTLSAGNNCSTVMRSEDISNAKNFHHKLFCERHVLIFFCTACISDKTICHTNMWKKN